MPLAEDYFLSVKTSERLSASPSLSLPASRVRISSTFRSRVPVGTTPVRWRNSSVLTPRRWASVTGPIGSGAPKTVQSFYRSKS